MTKRSESQGRSEMDKRRDMKSGSSHMNQDHSKSDTSIRDSGSNSGSMGSPGNMRQGGQTEIEHTNAGNTGFGSGQISPQTHNAPGLGRSGSGKSDASKSDSSNSGRKTASDRDNS